MSTVNILKFQILFTFLFYNKKLVIMARIHKMFLGIANREDHDQTASSAAIRSGYALFVLIRLLLQNQDDQSMSRSF